MEDKLLFSAPMAGVTDKPFRLILRKFTSRPLYTEMIGIATLFHNHHVTRKMLHISDEKNIIVQLVGIEEKYMAHATKEALFYGAKGIDINMGCPVPKVAVKSQAGSGLLKNPEKIYEIVKSVVDNVKIPAFSIFALGVAPYITAQIITQLLQMDIIPYFKELKEQGYTGKANWDYIKQVKEAVSIPVIGNGDIKDIESAKHMLEYTKCDAIMIGRGILGNPWLIKEIDTYLKTGKIIDKPSYEEKIKMCYKHLDYLLKIKSEHISILEMRSHISWYIKGIPYHKEVQSQCFKAKTKEEITEILDNYLKKLYN